MSKPLRAAWLCPGGGGEDRAEVGADNNYGRSSDAIFVRKAPNYEKSQPVSNHVQNLAYKYSHCAGL